MLPPAAAQLACSGGTRRGRILNSGGRLDEIHQGGAKRPRQTWVVSQLPGKRTADQAKTQRMTWRLAAENNFFAFVIAIPTAQLVADVGNALTPQSIALFVQHQAIQQFCQTLGSWQHRIPCIQRRQRCR